MSEFPSLLQSAEDQRRIERNRAARRCSDYIVVDGGTNWQIWSGHDMLLFTVEKTGHVMQEMLQGAVNAGAFNI